MADGAVEYMLTVLLSGLLFCLVLFNAHPKEGHAVLSVQPGQHSLNLMLQGWF